LWYLMPLPTIFQLYRDGQWSVLLVEKTIDLPEVTDKLYHNVVSSTSRLSRTRTLVVIGTDCICGYISNYYAIATATIIVLV
jgi:hypothetical protein